MKAAPDSCRGKVCSAGGMGYGLPETRRSAAVLGTRVGHTLFGVRKSKAAA